MRSYIFLVLAFAVLIGLGLAQNVDIGDVEAFQQALEQDGFTVQEGELGFFDFIKLCDEGVLPSAYGNNPTTKYLAYFIPPAPGYKLDERFSEIARTLGMSGNTASFWNLRPDEAVVFVGRTPYECRFFNFDLILMFRTYENEIRWVFAPPVDPLNMDVIKTEGTPDGQPGNPFNQTAIVITTADKGIDGRIRAAAQSAGYSDDIINTHILPSAMLNMGVENNSDVFGVGIRPAVFLDKEAGEEYINNTPATVLRITPNETTELDPLHMPVLRVRGTGTTEFDLMDDLEELRIAILDRYRGSNATELPTSIWVPDASDGIQRGINVIGPNNDCCYLWTASQPVESPTAPFYNTTGFYDFLQDSQVTLANDSDEFIIVYGVNHVATGKATYSNFAVYGADVWNGIRAITDAEFTGSAEEYLPDNPDAKYLYVYKLARNCESDPYCYEVPYGVGRYGIELDQPLFIGWRVYHEKTTKTGPSYSEIVYDRAIKFD
jgi:hypothetical protein